MSALLKTLGGMTPDERQTQGPQIHALREAVTNALAARKAALEGAALEAKLAAERLDMTLPADAAPKGSVHPVSQVMDEIDEIFADMGFAVATGPEIEDDWRNFTALNIPETHPARAMHDTFYFPDKDAVYRAVVGQVIAGWQQEFLAALRGEGDIVQRVGVALTTKHKAAMKLLEGSPHADELYGEHDRLSGGQFRDLDVQLQAALEVALGEAGVARPRLIGQMLLAASLGIGHKATSPAELGPALRLLSERLIRPELPA